jgi:hypothetical protein
MVLISPRSGVNHLSLLANHFFSILVYGGLLFYDPLLTFYLI